MLNRKYNKIGEQVDRQLSSTAPAEIQEGCVLCDMIEGGISKVTVLASVDGSESIAGIAVVPYSLPSQKVSVEQFTVPASGSLVFSLRYNNVVTLTTQAAVAGGSPLVVDETNFSATPATGHMKIDIAGGRVHFAAGDAGKLVTITYRCNLTVAQARMLFQERSLNNRDTVAMLQQISVAKGYIELSTDQFDTTADFSSGDPLQVGANGIITNTGSGAVIPSGKVLALPDQSGTAQGPFLTFSALIG